MNTDMKKKRSFYFLLLCFCFLLIFSFSRLFKKNNHIIFSTNKIKIYIEKTVPQEIKLLVLNFINENNKYELAETTGQITIGEAKNNHSTLIQERIFAVATNFSTLTDNITSEQWQNILSGKLTSWQPLDQRNLPLHFITDKQTFAFLSCLYPNLKKNKTVIIVPENKILKNLISDKGSIGILPFNQLTPQVKVLSFNNIDILDKNTQLTNYPFIQKIYLSGKKSEDLIAYLKNKIPLTNRDITKISTFAQTGVTAITRQAAKTIEAKNDPAYPARIVGPTLAKADLTHISNEIPMYADCVPPTAGTAFCGKSSYLASFDLSGVDIIGLTGNHLNDFGNQRLLETLKIFKKKKYDYFGGGKNLAEAQKILYKEINGTKIAFLGYNWYDTWLKENLHLNTPALAGENTPGANPYSEEQMKKDIETAKQNADIVSVEIQFQETYLTQPLPLQQTIFRKAIDFGADFVVGVQAHQPQKIEFYKNKPIFYGLGNLFFDQMFSTQVRQGIILWHVFYEGKHISTKLLTTMLYEYAQPRWMTPDERQQFLSTILP